MNIQQAFEASKKEKKPLLIIRYDQSLIDYQDITDDKKLDSILKIQKNRELLENEYVIYKLNTNSEDLVNNAIQKTFILYYTPNFILFDENGNALDFYNPINSAHIGVDIFEVLKDTLSKAKIKLEKRQILEEKLDNNSITDKELYELVLLNSEVHLKSQNLFNEYAKRKLEITTEIIQIINNQEFKTDDPIVEYILQTEKPEDENWEYYQLVLIQNISEAAQMSMDKEEFEKATFLQEKYNRKVIKNNSFEFEGIPLYDDKLSLHIISEQILEEKINFYSQTNDTENLIKYGNQFAEFFLKDYSIKKNEFVEKELINGDYIFSLVSKENLDTLTSKVIEDRKDKDKLRKIEENRYDEYTADALNRVSWVFYLLIDDISELEKATDWSLQSTVLKPKSYFYDTHAHLLLKTGRPKEALESEQLALDLATKENDIKYIEEYKIEIEKIKKKL
ncbi:hypothetical protein [Lacihabitans lacunae]|uniref:Thioredoxin family protein n=1 Tax=Lacihabitans lacunae TaxID=1028214 RepID=A0ABV7YZI4_9BACT